MNLTALPDNLIKCILKDEDNVVGMAGLSQRDVVLSQRAEEQLAQQKRDEELAKRLQEELEFEEDTDAKLAREAQDLEYAKMIHAKEKAKLKRAKERKKQKKLLEQQQQSHEREDDEESVISAPHLQLPARRPYMNTGAIDKHQYPENYHDHASSNLQNHVENQAELDLADESELSEPQYANVGPNAAAAAVPTVLHVRQTSDDGLPIPPYMPMQQSMSKKSTSLEKRIKRKKEKEGCKQQ